MKKQIEKSIKWICLLFLLTSYLPAYAFTTVDEQIDHYLKVLVTGSHASKKEMLERLQWSGLSDPRLYDAVRRQTTTKFLKKDLDKQTIELVTYQIRALGYSGNEKYRNTLLQIKKEAGNNKFKSHARKALNWLDRYIIWNQLIAEADIVDEGKSAEVTAYMKMLSVDDVFVQRMAARAIFHEKRRDPDLLALTAEKLEGVYMQEGLDKEAQDSAAWLCKAIGQSGELEYGKLLSKIGADTPYRKIKKYAKQYAL